MNINLFELEIDKESLKGVEVLYISKYLDTLNDCRRLYKITLEVGFGLTFEKYENSNALEDGDLVDVRFNNWIDCAITYCNRLLCDSPRQLTGIALINALSKIYLSITGNEFIAAREQVLINNCIPRLYPESYLTSVDFYAKDRVKLSCDASVLADSVTGLLVYTVLKDSESNLFK